MPYDKNYHCGGTVLDLYGHGVIIKTSLTIPFPKHSKSI